MPHQILKQVAESSKLTEKKRILKENESDELRKVLRYAYDPFMRFHLSPEMAPEPRNGGGNNTGTLDDVFTTLDALAAREYTGNAAQAFYGQMVRHLPLELRGIMKSILKKDLRCGIGSKTINSVFKGLVPQFDLMAAETFDSSKWNKYPCYVEPKLDGIRVVAICQKDGDVQIKSRGGRDLPALDFLEDQFRTIAQAHFKSQDVMFDGEVVGKNFNHTVSISRRKDADATEATFNVFDVVTSPFTATKKTPLSDRLEMLDGAKNTINRMENLSLLSFEIAYNEGDVLGIYEKYRKAGFEGAIVKDPDAPREGKRSKGWQKIKGQETYDLKVLYLLEGTGKYENMMGAAVVDFDGVDVRVSGFTDHDREWYWNNQNDLIGKVIEVEAHERTRDGSLRHPRFVRIRDDKS